MNNVLVRPFDVWAYFHAHKSEFTNDMQLIASTSDGSIGIYLTEDNGSPLFIVEEADDVIDEDEAITKVDCEETAERLYEEYLDPTEDDDISDITDRLKDDIIEKREDELNDYFQNLIMDILGSEYSEDNVEDIAEDIKERVLEYMARRYGVKLYRPMWLEDADGEFFSEYPYEEMVFDED